MSDFPIPFDNFSCKELTPSTPYPFKITRISRGTRIENYLILFPFYTEYKKFPQLPVFDLKTLQWSSLELKNSPEILTMTDNYTLVPYTANKFVLFGGYKIYSQAQPGNLFSLPELIDVKSVLGFTRAKVIDGKLSLEWEESLAGSKLLPYLEGYSADIEEGKLYIFGGIDKDGKMTNDLIRYDLSQEKMRIFKVESGDSEAKEDLVPCPRRNHGSGVKFKQLWIFGGETNESKIVNDFWLLEISRIDENAETNTVKCVKMKKNITNLRPKPGTPSVWINCDLAYIAGSVYATGSSAKNYLCFEEIHGWQERTTTHSLEEPLPFDRLPHTMEVWKKQLILGFESSIYTISLENEKISEEKKSGDSKKSDLKRPKKSFKDYMRQYFEERPYPDVTFKVQNENIKAHRGILSVRSSFFCELLTQNKEKSVIEISDLSSAGFLTLLEWIYCNEVLDWKLEAAEEIFKAAAEKYSVPKLKDEARKVLLKNYRENAEKNN